MIQPLRVEAGATSEEAIQIYNADYCITTRGINTVKRARLVRLYNTKFFAEQTSLYFRKRFIIIRL